MKIIAWTVVFLWTIGVLVMIGVTVFMLLSRKQQLNVNVYNKCNM